MTHKQTDQPIRVLHVIGCMDMGGAETFLVNMLRCIDRDKVMFDFLVHEERACHYDKELESLGAILHHVPRFNGANAAQYYSACCKMFAKHPEYRIVHGHIGSSAALYLHAAKRQGAFTIAHSHGMNYEKGIYRVAFSALSYPTRYVADAFFTCSLEAGIDRFGKNVANGPSFHIVNNGIDVSRFACSPEDHIREKERLGFGSRPLFFHSGRFTAVKNHTFLVDVFAEIRRMLPDALLLLAGGGELEDEIKAKCARLKLSDNVVFLGIRNDIPDLLKASDVFVFPSESEGLPCALVEAQASGLPCIVSTGVPEVACFLPSARRIPLAEGTAHWAELCVAAYHEQAQCGRHDRCTETQRAGYSAADTARWLQEYYESAYEAMPRQG